MLAMGHAAGGVYCEINTSVINPGAARAPGAFSLGWGLDVLRDVTVQHPAPWPLPSVAPVY